MKRSRIVQLTLVSSVASLLLSCRDKPTRYCVDDYQSVVDDMRCQGGNDGHNNHRHYHWHYGGAHGFVPFGTRLSGGSSTPPAGGFSEASHAGTARGGIGGAGEAASGGHGGGHGGGGGE